MNLKKNSVVMVLQPLLFCLMISCAKQTPVIGPTNPGPSINNDTTDMDTNTVKYSWLALGDSYTIGESVNEMSVSLLKQVPC